MPPAKAFKSLMSVRKWGVHGSGALDACGTFEHVDVFHLLSLGWEVGTGGCGNQRDFKTGQSKSFFLKRCLGGFELRQMNQR